MRLRLIPFILLLLIVAQQAEGATYERVRIMSYNIPRAIKDEGPNNDTWPQRVEALSVYLASVKPDIIGMQEPTRTVLMGLLSRMPGYAMVGTDNAGGAGDPRYNPIFYRTDRFRVVAYDTRWLTNTPTEVSRVEGSSIDCIATWALFEDKQTGARFIHTNTHLSTGSGGVHTQQIRYLKEAMKEVQETYGVSTHYLTGDFNMRIYENADGSSGAAFKGTNYVFCTSYCVPLQDLWAKAPHLYKSGSAIEGVDYIFSSHNVTYSGIHPENRWSPDGVLMSDHAPLWADTYFSTTPADDARLAIDEAWAAIDSTYTLLKSNARLITSAAQLSTDGAESSHPVSHIIDGKTETFCHSMWSAPVPNQPHYVEVSLARKINAFRFTYTRRDAENDGPRDRWQDVMVTASSDGQTWYYVTELYDFGGDEMQAYTSDVIRLRQPSQYLRFNVMRTPGEMLRNGHPQFSCSEFQLYEHLRRTDSPLLKNAEVKAAAANLQNLIAATQALIDEGTVSASDVTALQDATRALLDANRRALAVGAVRSAADEVLIFDVDGRRRSAPRHGINVVRTHQEARKVLYK
ncbi:MAG: discoidin domain-containing protein [Bacteroidaceae bacterium]|nr:discoidin domain-containing protein [Bacteroidaceae bacterium]